MSSRQRSTPVIARGVLIGVRAPGRGELLGLVRRTADHTHRDSDAPVYAIKVANVERYARAVGGETYPSFELGQGESLPVLDYYAIGGGAFVSPTEGLVVSRGRRALAAVDAEALPVEAKARLVDLQRLFGYLRLATLMKAENERVKKNQARRRSDANRGGRRGRIAPRPSA